MTPEQTERLEAALARIEVALIKLEELLSENSEVLRQVALGLGIPP